MKVVTLLVGMLVVSGVLHAQMPAAWPQWRGPQRDGLAAFSSPAKWPATLTKRWEVPVGIGHSSPVVAGTRVVLHTREGDREVLRAVDLKTGTLLWRDDYAAPYTINPAARGHGAGPKSTPVIADGRVFAFGISGILSAHDLTTGKLLWRTETPPAPPEFGTAMSPIVFGSMVVAHVGAEDKGTLTAFDAATGKPRWQWTGDGPAYASPVLATIGGTRQLVTQSENAVIGVAADDGQLLWRVPFRTSYDQNSITPIVVDDVVIYSGLDNGVTAVRIVRQGGAWGVEPKWKNEQTPMYMSTPTVHGTTLYGLTHRNRGQFFALDLGTGKTLWTTPGRQGENASIIAIGTQLLLATTEGEMIVAEASPAGFTETKRYRVAESATWAHPAVFGDTILVKDVDTLICWGL